MSDNHPDPFPLTVSMGCLSLPIERQLYMQSLKLNLSPFERDALQQDADEVSRLYARGVLSESEKKNAQRRIIKTIKKHLKPHTTQEAQP